MFGYNSYRYRARWGEHAAPGHSFVGNPTVAPSSLSMGNASVTTSPRESHLGRNILPASSISHRPNELARAPLAEANPASSSTASLEDTNHGENPGRHILSASGSSRRLNGQTFADVTKTDLIWPQPVTWDTKGSMQSSYPPRQTLASLHLPLDWWISPNLPWPEGHKGGPSVHLQSSRLHFDGRLSASWEALPNELQIQILSYIIKLASPVSSVTRTKYAKGVLLSLSLVNKRMAEQVRYIYQKHHFILVHGLSYQGRSTYNTYYSNPTLRHPQPRFCTEITSLELRFFLHYMLDEDIFKGPYSLAVLFRYRQEDRELRARSPLEAAAEAYSARSIAWQTHFASLRHFKILFDWAHMADQALAMRQSEPSRCFDEARKALVALLKRLETAFPNVDDVEVKVENLLCLGHTGTWSREEGLVRGDPRGMGCRWTSWANCPVGCPQVIGEALEGALVRGEEL